MNKTARFLVQAALIGAMYAALAQLQNFILPESATMMVQFRVAEVLCVLALFTPAAVPGLTVGCFVFNLSFAGALPLDLLVGSLATALACQGMWLLRRRPWVALSLPALVNGLLVGWELSVYVGGGFWLNALCVAAGELGVLYVLGPALLGVLKKHAGRLFSAK